MQNMVNFLVAVFPILDGFDLGAAFCARLIVFTLCLYLNYLNPMKWVWSGLFLLGYIPIALFSYPAESAQVQGPIVLVLKVYLAWMCAEVSFRSLAEKAEARIRGWWALAVLLVFFL